MHHYVFSGNGAAAGASADVVRAYDRSKSFYTLVGLPSSEVVLLVADRPGRYSVEEWESLLQVRMGLPSTGGQRGVCWWWCC